MKASYKDNPELLASSVKRRIDPADLYNVKIRPVGSSRVEIILPTGGKHQSEAEEQIWDHLLGEAPKKFPPPEGKDLDVGRAKVQDLVAVPKQHQPEPPISEIAQLTEHTY